MLSESKIIKSLYDAFPSHIGDDAAVIHFLGEYVYVITKDVLLEDVHFRLHYTSPENLAQKALQVNLSDLAAMGATPKFILLGISIPEKQATYAEQFLSHFSQHCEENRVTLIGGDTTASPDKLYLSITVIGLAQEKKIKYRHTAQADNIICVIGELGYAHIGLTALEQSLDGFESYKKKSLAPQALVTQGMWLSEQNGVNAMMDISDGLYVDLGKLCKAAKLGAEINVDNFNYTADFVNACKTLKLDFYETCLTGGEDYGLLCIVNKQNYGDLCEAYFAKFGKKIKRIGKMTIGNSVILKKAGSVMHLPLKNYAHFGETE